MPSKPGASGNLYWVTVFVLLAFGMLAILSIGAAFLLVGVTLIVLSPFRSRPSIFWPGLGLVIGFLVGYALITPWYCSQSAIFEPAVGGTSTSPVVCRSLIGVEYSGSENFEPSRTLGLAAGGITAVLAPIGASITVRARGHSKPSLTKPPAA